MSWFPTFFNPLNALIAAGIVIPALLVLYFLKLRRREVAVSSTLLWRKAIQDLQVNAPFQKLRRNLLLLLQLFLLLLLLLAVARPVTNYTPPPGKTTVLLIDRSGSMSALDQNGKSRLDEAKAQARDLVDAMPSGGTAMVIAFDDHADPVQSFTSDTNMLKAAISRIQPTDRRSDIKLAYQLADAQLLNFNPAQLRSDKELPDVRVYSDGRLLNPEDATVHGNVRYEKIGSDQAANVGIVALSAKRNYERPTQVQVFARLANYGPEPVEVPVQLSIDGEKLDVSTARADELLLLPERWKEEERQAWESKNNKRHRDSVEFKLDLARAAVIRLEQLHKKNDVLSADDVAQVVVPPPKALSVLLVTDGYDFFLAKAVRALPVKSPDVTQPADYETKKPTNYDVIIFDNYKPTFLPEAGNFVWFNVVPDGVKTKVVSATSQPADATGDIDPAVVENVRVLDWKRDHPILADLALGDLFFAKALRLKVPPDREVLMDGMKGPLIVLERAGKATHLIAGFNPMDTSWPLVASFPLFLDQALQFMAVGANMEVRQTLFPGEVVRVPRTNLLQAGADLKKIKLDGPGGVREVLVPDAGEFVLPTMDRVGLYKTDPPIPGFEQLAVNMLDANESNVLPADSVPAAAPLTEADKASGEGGKRRLELWWWLALGALVVLSVEWLVYTRRVHL